MCAIFMLSVGASVQTVEASSYNEQIDIVYHLYEDGTTVVEALINLSRQTDNTYLTEFSFDLGGKRVSSANATINGQVLTTTQSESSLSVMIPQEFGVQEELSLRLEFDLDALATHVGSVWEVFIPIASSGDDITVTRQQISVITPLSWKSLWYSSHPYERIETTETSMLTRYQLDETRQRNPLSLIYGEDQWYVVSAQYVLTNPSEQKVKQHIALIPDITGYQEMYVKSLEPMPSKLIIDSDQNWLSEYVLEAGETTSITYEAYVRLLKKSPRLVDNSESLVPYTIADTYWESNDPRILDITATMSSAKDAYDYVTSQFTYGSTRAQGDAKRLGAVLALEKKDQAVCMEFTDMTIASLRALSIPARELNGYAYVSKANGVLHPTVSDELHSWVEYYDEQQGWTSIDPTWGATTGDDYFSAFDSAHIVFVTRGISSSLPLPAGSYRLYNDTSRQVDVQVLDAAPAKMTRSWDWLDSYNYAQKPWWEKFWLWVSDLF